MNILLIGSGGREHALAWKIVQSPDCDTLYCAPGNAGIAKVASIVTVEISDHKAISEFCLGNSVDLVVIGPEVPLVEGLSDHLRAQDILVVGPSQAAAQLEGSKSFTKELCAEFNIPTASFARFNNAPKAKTYLRQQTFPIVIKADGLAAGKGVFISETLADACEAIDDCFEGAFGKAGREVVIEEFLVGEEASMFFLCDGHSALQFGTAQDHKRVGEGETGPNTGGMGAYSPAPVMDAAMIDRTINEIILPTLAGMSQRGMPFHGVLYAGLMITKTGPQLIEYNVRFGDPECQVLMLRLESDLLPILVACAEGDLSGLDVRWSDDAALTVVMAANGYPGPYNKGSHIKGLDNLNNDLIQVFHAGTEEQNSETVAIGGRVLNVTARDKSVSEAQKRAYQTVDKIDWPDGFCRRDIGWRAIAREK